jgi:hypothetical protein
MITYRPASLDVTDSPAWQPARGVALLAAAAACSWLVAAAPVPITDGSRVDPFAGDGSRWP